MSAQNDNPKYSEPAYTKSANRAKFPFYIPNIDKKLAPETRELLEKYSHITPEQQSQHVHKVRDLAWDIRAYPCTGIGSWVVPQLRRSPAYPEVLERVKAGETLMDVGCFIGHDLRRLAYDGAPSTNLYGVDIVNYWNVGYEMFRDKGRFDAHFIEADVLSESDPALLPLKGKIDIVSITHVLHSWDWDGQIKAAKALVTFTKPGSMIVGSQVGNHRAHEVTVKPLPTQWRQNPESIEKFWNQVESETGTKWETQAWIRSFEEMGWHSEDHKWMEDGLANVEFVVKRTQ